MHICYIYNDDINSDKTLYVKDAMKNRRWVETEDDNCWDIYWAEKGQQYIDKHQLTPIYIKEWIHDKLDDFTLKNNQRVNHFRNHFEVTKAQFLFNNNLIIEAYKKGLDD